MTPLTSCARVIVLLFASAALVCPQSWPQGRDDSPRRPDGKSLREEILKADHESNLKDVQRLIQLAEELKAELEKNDRHVLSVASLKKAEDIQKLAERVRKRLRKF